MPITLRINGEARTLPEPVTLQVYLEANDLLLPFMAVARNGDVLHKHEYPRVTLQDGDVVEIVRMVGGG
jgi:sulfur carrier protein